MKKKLTSRSAFFNRRMLISLAFCAIGVLLALIAFALYPGATARAQGAAAKSTLCPTPTACLFLSRAEGIIFGRSGPGRPVEIWIGATDLSESHVLFPHNGPAALNEGGRSAPPCGPGGLNSLNDNFAINVLTLLLSSEKKVFRLNRFQNSHHDSKR
jgi:hypothetical protein